MGVLLLKITSQVSKAIYFHVQTQLKWSSGAIKWYCTWHISKGPHYCTIKLKSVYAKGKIQIIVQLRWNQSMRIRLWTPRIHNLYKREKSVTGTKKKISTHERACLIWWSICKWTPLASFDLRLLYVQKGIYIRTHIICYTSKVKYAFLHNYELHSFHWNWPKTKLDFKRALFNW